MVLSEGLSLLLGSFLATGEISLNCWAMDKIVGDRGVDVGQVKDRVLAGNFFGGRALVVSSKKAVEGDPTLADADPSGFIPVQGGNRLQSPDSQIFLSLASLWEIQIKSQLGKLTLRGQLASIVQQQQLENGLRLLAIKVSHILALRNQYCLGLR
ncbi:hypothetical protein [Leptolyngbya sp. PCC 6406]|uniref:hypothetical protein n=1 Tax=Leptolyngbya sp. PCC 6406 TaxID=1173264 RepID=UPI0002ACAD70|nr:hypothetical protein [Leptolyngbya sp. PCC 6406]